MPSIVPQTRPQATRDRVAKILLEKNVEAQVVVIGCRGYFRDSMGAVGRNDRGIYDDAIAVFSPTAYVTFNANTDPGVARPGVAVLKAGLWRYKVGTHGLSKPKYQQYLALVQAAPVTVLRDNPGGEPRPDTGWFGINIHRGSRNSTSSLGCQTIHPDQWAVFFALVRQEMKRHGVTEVPFLLLEGQG